MDVQLASELDPAAEAGRLGQWAASYRTSGGLGSWLAPRRAAGERWQAVIRGARWDEIDQRDLADPGPMIAHRRARLPGRKNLVWVAGILPVEVDHFGTGGPPGWQNAELTAANPGGFNSAPGDAAQIDRVVFQHAFQPAMQALHLANIAVYAADGRGLVSTPNAQASGTSGRKTASTSSTSSPSQINPLRVLAEDTGGRTFESSNDIQKGIRSAIDDAEV